MAKVKITDDDIQKMFRDNQHDKMKKSDSIKTCVIYQHSLHISSI